MSEILTIEGILGKELVLKNLAGHDFGLTYRILSYDPADDSIRVMETHSGTKIRLVWARLKREIRRGACDVR